MSEREGLLRRVRLQKRGRGEGGRLWVSSSWLWAAGRPVSPGLGI